VKANECGSTPGTVFTSSEPSKERPQPSFFRLAVMGEGGLLLLAWGLARWWGVDPFRVFGPVETGFGWGTAATVPLLLGLAWMLSSTAGPVRRLVDLVVEQVGPLLSSLTIWQLALLAALAGFSEEILFRGVLQAGLSAWMPDLGALAVSSVLFGLVHFASREYAIMATVMGAYLGTLFLVQGSLLVPIVTHALYDFVALTWVVRRHRTITQQQLGLRGG
jgi:membrane protease YdiL (CAAX protease family)